MTTVEQAPREDALAAEGVQPYMAGDPANYPPAAVVPQQHTRRNRGGGMSAARRLRTPKKRAREGGLEQQQGTARSQLKRRLVVPGLGRE